MLHRVVYAALGALAGLAPLAADAAPEVDACVAFGCQQRAQVRLDAVGWRAIAELFRGVDSAPAERAAVARAIARFETEVGRQTDTRHDLAKNWRRAGEPGELDCIAESTNTDQYLQLLADAGLLRFHRVAERQMRGVLLVHWTAVLEETAGGEAWAVDSWFRDNGEPPVILPLARWYDYGGPEE